VMKPYNNLCVTLFLKPKGIHLPILDWNCSIFKPGVSVFLLM
jgi:hypothetical protein